MKIEVQNRCTDFNSYRAARVKSLFNAESGANFNLTADLGIDDGDWKIGLIVGPSGSGKTSIGKMILGGGKIYEPEDWPHDKPIVDHIAPEGDFDVVTGALAAVGLGDVPAWLRPYPVLSNGEKFRANMARIIAEQPAEVVVDEFTSVVDRQIAKFGALAFQKAWRRAGGKCVLLSCHYDVIDWIEPDWVFDTATRQFQRGSLWRRPKFDVEIWQTDWRYWPLFKPHYYLDLPIMPAAACFVGVVDGEPVAHVGVGTRPGLVEARASRLVVMPEWQGAGIGLRFLNTVAEMYLSGNNRHQKKMPLLFHTSHPGLCAAFRRDPKWVQLSASISGGQARKPNKSGAVNKTHAKLAKGNNHFRAVQGFRYLGEYAPKK